MENEFYKDDSMRRLKLFTEIKAGLDAIGKSELDLDVLATFMEYILASMKAKEDPRHELFANEYRRYYKPSDIPEGDDPTNVLSFLKAAEMVRRTEYFISK